MVVTCRITHTENPEPMNSVSFFPASRVSAVGIRVGGMALGTGCRARGCFVAERAVEAAPQEVPSLSTGIPDSGCILILFLNRIPKLSLLHLESEKLRLIINVVCAYVFLCLNQNSFTTTVAATTPTKKTFPHNLY